MFLYCFKNINCYPYAFNSDKLLIQLIYTLTMLFTKHKKYKGYSLNYGLILTTVVKNARNQNVY